MEADLVEYRLPEHALPIPRCGVTQFVREDYSFYAVERQRRGPRSIEASVDVDHTRWVITPPDHLARRHGWVFELAGSKTALQGDGPARQSSGIALASRVKVLVAHVVARS